MFKASNGAELTAAGDAFVAAISGRVHMLEVALAASEARSAGIIEAHLRAARSECGGWEREAFASDHPPPRKLCWGFIG